MKTEQLDILVVDDDVARQRTIQAGLEGAGYNCVMTACALDGIARVILELHPDMVIFSLGVPSGSELNSVLRLVHSLKLPVVMFVDEAEPASIQAAVDAKVSAFIVDGLHQDRLASVVDLALARFNANLCLEDELENAREQLQSQKSIDRAKLILMKSRSISEGQAYAALRKTAMNQNQKIVEVANSIITASQLL
ncbi:putative transcriptional regulatory protein pdtaR [Pseudovibrio axinellae]|uniref:Putative transcriptional regulatory protein pdtaR n=1 Tax=Pseudovibrio axinellae TaxID=989403 RepID=A0A166BDJ8_9HYPH|nr:ANTAR domain-containing protein [Pseudovibrio axinellae]KZL22156.1 putative transcriptional regulatory protein pdtaR [Pseudovibrio axinellae]SEQ53112.1 response regulator receiver and ANTAR domain protein [Pseudovibrio axinellae]